MTLPFPCDNVMKVPREFPFRPDVPRSCDQKEDSQIFPSQKRAISQACFAIKHRQQKKNRRRINNAEQTFAEASEGRANPEAGEPSPSVPPSLITAQTAEDRARHERADERFRHDNAREQKCT